MGPRTPNTANFKSGLIGVFILASMFSRHSLRIGRPSASCGFTKCIARPEEQEGGRDRRPLARSPIAPRIGCPWQKVWLDRELLCAPRNE